LGARRRVPAVPMARLGVRHRDGSLPGLPRAPREDVAGHRRGRRRPGGGVMIDRIDTTAVTDTADTGPVDRVVDACVQPQPRTQDEIREYLPRTFRDRPMPGVF